VDIQKEIVVDMVRFGFKELHIPVLRLQTMMHDSFLSIKRFFSTSSFRMKNLSDGVFVIEALFPVQE